MAIIGLDGTCLSIYGKGVSRHQYNLIKALSKLDRENYYYVFLNKKNMPPELPKSDNFHYVRVYMPKRIIWEQFQLPYLAMKYKLGIYHSIVENLPVVSKIKFVLSVVEIPNYREALLCRGGHNSLYTRLSLRYNRLFFLPSLKKAKVIITCSNSTKEDLIRRYNLDARKIRVLYHAPDEQFSVAKNENDLLATRRRYNAETGYILHISSSDPRDNTPCVIRAYHKAGRHLPAPKKLVICGNVDPQGLGLKPLIRELGLKNSLIFTGYVSEKELVALYRAADLFIAPSFYEGFGFQVVEAMACGVAVIASNVTSLPEIVADAGILLGPMDIDGFASAMVRILTDSEYRAWLRKRSLERAKFFSWHKTVRETLDIYNELIFQ